MGHDIAIFAYYGLQGAKVDWGDIPMYPNMANDFGIKFAGTFYKDHKADILLTLTDAWVLKDLDRNMNWVPWFPVDHDPVPQRVVAALKGNPGLVKAIAMSRFGQEQVRNFGIESYYIPHLINTDLYAPSEESRNLNRNHLGWQKKFVIGTVGTNHEHRKNWEVGMQAVAKFSKYHPGEVMYYCHTNAFDERGINLQKLRERLGIVDITRFPDMSNMITGISMEIMAATYNSMDVFLLPTKGEGFGIPIVEAMACGIPVITTACTAQTEICENGGGWMIKDLLPEWSGLESWQFECRPDEIVELLEQAYQAKKSGAIIERKELARKKALEYSEELHFDEYWIPVLADIEKRIKEPKNLEGIQSWRLAFIPPSCVPRKVLDLGSGLTMPYKPALETLGEYVAVDNRASGKDGIIKADAHDLPFSNGEFGFVWCSELLEHVKEPYKVVQEAKRVSKHGVILFSTPQNSNFRLDPDHKIVNTPHAITATGDGLISW